MKTIQQLIILLFASILPLSIGAQKSDAVKETFETLRTDSSEYGLEVGVSLGWDFSTVAMLNPRPNEGKNSLGFGGLLNFYTNYTGKKYVFDNRLNVQMAFQRLGDRSEPFVKTADVFRVNTLVGRRLRKKLFLAAMGDLQTQMVPTYGNGFLSSNNNELPITSEPFAPAIIKVTPGLLYRPKPNLKVLVSAISSRLIVVNNAQMAAQVDSSATPNDPLGIYGNALGQSLSGQWGAELRGEWTQKLCNEKIVINSVVDLYSNYVRNPENIVFEWYNSVDLVIFKNLALNLRSEWFYDHNILVQIGGNPNQLGRRIFIRNGAFVKFSKIF